MQIPHWQRTLRPAYHPQRISLERPKRREDG
jgi:hypothetical protein